MNISRTGVLVLVLFLLATLPVIALPGNGTSGGKPAAFQGIGPRSRAGLAPAAAPVPDHLRPIYSRIIESGIPGCSVLADRTGPPGPARSRILSGTAAEPSEVIDETWDSDQGQWINWRRTLSTYTLLGAPLEIITYYWAAAAWLEYSRNRYEYDKDGYLVDEYEDEWDGQAWVAVGLVAYLNDPSGRALSAVYQEWIAAQWQNVSRWTYSYDGSGNILQEQLEIWAVSVWTNYVLLTFTYDISNNLTSFEYASWNGLAWANLFRSVLTYDTSGWLVLALIQVWNGAQWEDDSRATYTNDAGGRPLQELWEIWSGTAWGPDLRRTKTYDAGGNLTEDLEETWNGTMWVNSRRILNTWNFSAGPGAMAPAGAGGSVAADLLQSVDQNWFDTVWVNYHRTTYTYGPGTDAASPEETPAGYRLEANYPNPFNPSTTVGFSLPGRSSVRLAIFDMLGREVALLAEGEKPAGIHEIRWDAAHMPTGVYYCRMQSGNFIQTRKLLLMR